MKRRDVQRAPEAYGVQEILEPTQRQQRLPLPVKARALSGACLVIQPGDLGRLQATRQTDPAALEAALGQSAGTGSRCSWSFRQGTQIPLGQHSS